MNGVSRTRALAVKVLAAKVSETEVVNTTNPTTVFIGFVPGGTLGTQAGLELDLIGNIENNSGGTRTPTVTITYGAQTVFTGALGSLNDGSNRSAWVLRLLLWAQGVSAQVASVVSLVGAPDDADGGGIAGNNSTNRSGFNRSLTVDSAVDQSLTISVTNDLAHANMSVRVDAVRLKVLEF